jgi:ABC-type uncharacterized transport system substrate-binding protein
MAEAKVKFHIGDKYYYTNFTFEKSKDAIQAMHSAICMGHAFICTNSAEEICIVGLDPTQPLVIDYVEEAANDGQ